MDRLSFIHDIKQKAFFILFELMKFLTIEETAIRLKIIQRTQ